MVSIRERFESVKAARTLLNTTLFMCQGVLILQVCADLALVVSGRILNDEQLLSIYLVTTPTQTTSFSQPRSHATLNVLVCHGYVFRAGAPFCQKLMTPFAIIYQLIAFD